MLLYDITDPHGGLDCPLRVINPLRLPFDYLTTTPDGCQKGKHGQDAPA
jgi:hypothetical protein